MLRSFTSPAASRVKYSVCRPLIFSLSDVDSFNRLFVPVLRNRSDISAVIVADGRGKAALLSRRPDGAWQNRLTDRAAWGKRQRWRTWRDDGQVIEDAWHDADYDPLQRPWHAGAMRLPHDREVYWTEPYVFFERKDPGITASAKWRDARSGEVHALDGPGFRSVQFHPESVLTQHGPQILSEMLHSVLLPVPVST